ncbi:SRSO17 transposase [Streptomyces sp. TLI_55]|uniref:IS701 family transposase n=1 Tax=Streptomyces sp. TLI_55 TaxID=1938861 RepID=UPI000BD3D429|nr:transposase [Streptomyces sp. TLI_55]SNX62490.1 SRSO17 transposase [Streptomyces sp. TLI_55]
MSRAVFSEAAFSENVFSEADFNAGFSQAVFDRPGADLGWAGFHQPPDVVAELSAALFPQVLRRKDQRWWAEQYVRGLLAADGRKSVRRIASAVGGGAAEQSLHHLIAASTWDWSPLRAALAQRLQDAVTPAAWVVQPMAIPKVGEHSVGVGRQFVRRAGRPDSGQQAFGLWFASEQASAPVNWRLHLPGGWIRDAERRRRAEIPEAAGEETLEECAAAVVRSTLKWELPRRPVILGAAGPDLGTAMRRYREAGVPLLVRVPGGTALAVAEPSLPGFGAGPLAAQRIADSVRALRRPVQWADPLAGPAAVRSSLVVGVPVTLPDDGRPGLLLGEWPGPRSGPRSGLRTGPQTDPRHPPTEFWLTDLDRMPVPALLRLAKLARRVARDCATTGEQVGLRDFVGRSFKGWHRHTTLASVAYAARTLDTSGASTAPARSA